jgi:CBS domain-containing protein
MDAHWPAISTSVFVEAGGTPGLLSIPLQIGIRIVLTVRSAFIYTKIKAKLKPFLSLLTFFSTAKSPSASITRHSGGAGMLVREIMTENPITVTGSMEIITAAKILLDQRINGLPVVDASGKLVGILCQSDIIAQQKKFPLPSLFSFLDGYISLSSMRGIEKEVRKIAATAVSDAMTPNPVTVGPDSSIETVAALMVDHNFHTLPVVEKEMLVGVVGKEDILRTLIPGER